MSEELVWALSIQDGRIFAGRIGDFPTNGVLCFSMVAPVQAVAGCSKVLGVGGYTEVVLDDPTSGALSVGFVDERFEIFNYSWLPEGAHVRQPDGSIIEVRIEFTGQEVVIAEPDYGPVSDGLQLVPAPSDWVAATGTLDCRGGFKLETEADFSGALGAVDALALRNNLGVFLGAGVALKVSSDFDGPDEGYELTISPDGVVIRANSDAGAFYAGVSLLSLCVNHGGEVPCGTITDYPRFGWRGQHLDCARHFFEPETIMQFLDMIALFKLNRLHWHFSDDEAFRLEVTSYPEIWQQTRMRGAGQLVPGVFGGGSGPTGGSYSLEFTAELIARAAELQIEVLPEIEIPAHAYALTRIFPQMRDPGDNTAEESIQGYLANTMNPAMPFTWEFIENLTAEVAAIFPFAHVHLGCDERPPAAWEHSPAAKALMAEHGLDTLDDLQGWFMDRAAKIVVAKGATPCAWEEAVKGKNGGIGNGAILFSWTGQGPGLDAAREGYKVVMCPAQNVYFDMAHSEGWSERGTRWAGTVSLEDTVEWLPVPADEPELEGNIIGVQGQFWSEFSIKDADMWPMMIPRVLGLSESAWRADDDRASAASIRASVAGYQPLLRALDRG